MQWEETEHNGTEQRQSFGRFKSKIKCAGVIFNAILFLLPEKSLMGDLWELFHTEIGCLLARRKPRALRLSSVKMNEWS